MKTFISLCVVMSIAVATHGQMMPDFGGMFKQAASMIPGMSGGNNPFSAMMKQMEGMVGNPEQMMQLFQQSMSQIPEAGQEMMGQFMQQMNALKDQGASPEQYMALLNQMKQAASG